MKQLIDDANNKDIPKDVSEIVSGVNIFTEGLVAEPSTDPMICDANIRLSKNEDSKLILPPPPLKKLPEFFLMTSYLDSQTRTDVKPDMLPGVQTGNGIPHDRCNLRGIAHARTNRKDDIFMERRLGQIITCILERG